MRASAQLRIMIKKRIELMILGMLAILSGCVSIAERRDAAGPIGVYPGVSYDAWAASAVFADDPQEQAAGIWVLPFVLIDFPFSLVLDTIMLPWDLSDSREKESDHIGIGPPITEGPSHTTVRRDRLYGGSAD